MSRCGITLRHSGELPPSILCADYGAGGALPPPPLLLPQVFNKQFALRDAATDDDKAERGHSLQ